MKNRTVILKKYRGEPKLIVIVILYNLLTEKILSSNIIGHYI